MGIRFRRGDASSNPILAAGEPGYETDTGKVAVGDGTTAWNDLPNVGGATVASELPDSAPDGTLFVLAAPTPLVSHTFTIQPDGEIPDATTNPGDPQPWPDATNGPSSRGSVPILALSGAEITRGAVTGPAAPGGVVVALVAGAPAVTGITRFIVGQDDYRGRLGTPSGTSTLNLVWSVISGGNGPALGTFVIDNDSVPMTRLRIGVDIGNAFHAVEAFDVNVPLLEAGDTVALAFDADNRRWWGEVNGDRVTPYAVLVDDGAGGENVEIRVDPDVAADPPDIAIEIGGSAEANFATGMDETALAIMSMPTVTQASGWSQATAWVALSVDHWTPTSNKVVARVDDAWVPLN